jgi:hypothetical protein
MEIQKAKMSKKLEKLFIKQSQKMKINLNYSIFRSKIMLPTNLMHLIANLNLVIKMNLLLPLLIKIIIIILIIITIQLIIIIKEILIY